MTMPPQWGQIASLGDVAEATIKSPLGIFAVFMSVFVRPRFDWNPDASTSNSVRDFLKKIYPEFGVILY